MKPTRRDPQLEKTRAAIAHLVAGQDARERYDRLLAAAMREYGDRHPYTPDATGVRDGCTVCGQGPHSPALISGICADHFPNPVKDALRTYARLIGEHTDQAWRLWQRAGRRPYETLRPMLQDYRKLADGRVSYY